MLECHPRFLWLYLQCFLFSLNIFAVKSPNRILHFSLNLLIQIFVWPVNYGQTSLLSHNPMSGQHVKVTWIPQAQVSVDLLQLGCFPGITSLSADMPSSLTCNGKIPIFSSEDKQLDALLDSPDLCGDVRVLSNQVSLRVKPIQAQAYFYVGSSWCDAHTVLIWWGSSESFDFVRVPYVRTWCWKGSFTTQIVICILPYVAKRLYIKSQTRTEDHRSKNDSNWQLANSRWGMVVVKCFH